LVTLFFQTRNGTLVVEIDDPEGMIQVSIVGENFVINDKQKEGEPITLRAGDHQLHVTRGELEFDSDNVTLKRGEKVVVNVKLAAGQVQVVRNDKPIGQGDMPAPISADPDRRAAEWVLSLGGSVKVDRSDESFTDRNRLPAGAFRVWSIRLTNTAVRDADLTQLAELRGLIGVSLMSTTISDEGLSHLARIPTLTVLGLNSTRISNEGAARLKQLPLLRVLYLGSTALARYQPLRH
jgi:hypothetical protein